jgi:acetoin utilization deacetylase AcuC-like enzyme
MESKTWSAGMKTITKAAWDRVLEKACDIANATRTENDTMYDVHREQMLELLDELEVEFGKQSRILDTRADYIDDPIERLRLYTKALELAKEQNDEAEIEIILLSIGDL